YVFFFFFQAEDGIRSFHVTGVQTCALPIFALIAIALCSMVIHEWAHAAVADLEGDPVPRDMGRVTLNPFAHLDPFGSLIVPVVTFAALGLALGWCRPIPLQPMSLYRRGAYARVIAAGPAANLMLAGICGLVGYEAGARVNLAL